MTGWDVETVSSHATSGRSGRGAPTVTRQAADLGMQPTMPMKVARPQAGRVAMGALFGSVALFAGLLVWRQGQSNAVESAPPVVTAAPPRTDSAAQPSLSPSPNAAGGAAKPTAADSARLASAAATKKVAGTRDTTKKSKPAATPSPATPLAKTTVPPTPVSDEQGIHDVLDHFTVVMGNGEVSIRNAFPGMPPTLLENLKTIFTNTDRVSARSQQGPPSINGDRAEVQLNVTFSFQRRGSPQPETAMQRYEATLTKRGAQWELSGLSQRP